MTEELKNTVTVAEMLRTTGKNTAGFMEQVASHIEKLEEGIAQLQARVTELENLSKSE
jgi:pyridoxal biosynthesis lyase PdxS